MVAGRTRDRQARDAVCGGACRRAAAARGGALSAEARAQLCVLLMHPNLYASAEALADPVYLDRGVLDGLRVRVLHARAARLGTG